MLWARQKSYIIYIYRYVSCHSLCGEAKPKHLTKPGDRSIDLSEAPPPLGPEPAVAPEEVGTPVKAMPVVPDAGMRQILKKRKELRQLEVWIHRFRNVSLFAVVCFWQAQYAEAEKRRKSKAMPVMPVPKPPAAAAAAAPKQTASPAPAVEMTTLLPKPPPPPQPPMENAMVVRPVCFDVRLKPALLHLVYFGRHPDGSLTVVPKPPPSVIHVHWRPVFGVGSHFPQLICSGPSLHHQWVGDASRRRHRSSTCRRLNLCASFFSCIFAARFMDPWQPWPFQFW